MIEIQQSKTADTEAVRYHKLMQHPRAVFVFGSNLRGVHGAGAARAALEYGAKRGVGRGPEGRTYAIPTKRTPREVLPLEVVRSEVRRFLLHAIRHPNSTFVVTRVGCGLAGYSDTDIAPMFSKAPDNCVLPEGWAT